MYHEIEPASLSDWLKGYLQETELSKIVLQELLRVELEEITWRSSYLRGDWIDRFIGAPYKVSLDLLQALETVTDCSAKTLKKIQDDWLAFELLQERLRKNVH